MSSGINNFCSRMDSSQGNWEQWVPEGRKNDNWTAGSVKYRAWRDWVIGHSRTAAGRRTCSVGMEAGSYLLSASSAVPNILALIFFRCFLTATFMASSRSPGTR